ncbi:hypothetical protein AVEN_139042-1 [Araneus ventricosus]|uniref:Uncharacterized protein n=1 Tax=Araneus ventricosus TaxID=182803 RepID=A0A4Y2MAH9_ARAVE|nr:hypothetical protein AVEN_267034-1 [Araneus ventricosus]GBN22733.1 hypothetical protein AVEN_15915-1 [Araneus ventricosus]GBN22809.1 hypothetical protein AVEN_132788-1 [Araneus ventricosus]GBN22816.1 hypothetical protein AVEN_139042-1 [Araneus ventricosus]
MGFRRGIRNLTIQQKEAIVNVCAQGCTLLELGKQFNTSESGISKFLKRWIDQGGVPKVPKSETSSFYISSFRQERLTSFRCQSPPDGCRHSTRTL